MWALLIFSFSSSPAKAVSEVHWQDFIFKKFVHVCEYGVFTLLLFRALLKSGVRRKNALVYSLITAILYGVTDEFHQSFTPGREPHIRDVFFDTVGASLTVFLIARVLPVLPGKYKYLVKQFDLV